MAQPVDDARRVARDIFGFADLRPGQAEAMVPVIEGRDALVVMPTGSGKSAVYQVPALLRDGPTVVVSPLIALQRDQVSGLADIRHTGARAAEINSAVPAAVQAEALADLENGRLEFAFLSPEQLQKPDVLEAVARARPSLFVVDEAHCISGWGHDFRPDYLLVGGAVEAVGRPPILALTATASPPVRVEIVERLHMRDPVVVVRGFDRPNISLSVESFLEATVEEKDDALVQRVLATAGSGIVYAATRKRAELVAERLVSRGKPAAAYHAGMAARERHRVHEAFRDDSVGVVVATTAFGMGIDKPNVRFVMHADVSESVDSYYQELGRAGRDGDKAEAVLFYRPEDLGLRRFFAAGGAVGFDALAPVIAVLAAAARPVSRARLQADTGLSRPRLAAVLNRLESLGALRTTRAGVRLVADTDPETLIAEVEAMEAARGRVEQSRVEMMRGYAETRSCRREFLLNYFGEQLGHPCGNCDVCRRDPVEEDLLSAPTFAPDTRVIHKQWGEGLLVRADGDVITVLFDDVGYKTLSLRLVAEEGLLDVAGLAPT